MLQKLAACYVCQCVFKSFLNPSTSEKHFRRWVENTVLLILPSGSFVLCSDKAAIAAAQVPACTVRWVYGTICKIHILLIQSYVVLNMRLYRKKLSSLEIRVRIDQEICDKIVFTWEIKFLLENYKMPKKNIVFLVFSTTSKHCSC